MDLLTSPPSPELTHAQIEELAAYAKSLGQVKTRSRANVFAGNVLSKKKGNGLDLHEVRPYSISDEVRHMDWRITARTGTPHTKVYSEEIEHRNFLILHLSKDAYFGTRTTFISTRYAQLAALISWRSQYKREAIGAYIAYGQHQFSTPAINDWQQWISYLWDCTHTKHRAQEPQSMALPTHFHMRNRTIIILSDLMSLDNEALSRLQQMAQHNRIYWLALEDKNVLALPDGSYEFSHMNGIQSVEVSSRSRQAARHKYDAQQTYFEQTLANMGVHRLLFNVDESPIAIARTLMLQGVIH